ncbi:hypothetical protein PENSTE_c002G00485 [Penicillium steckii]|uniref:Ubiquitin-like domain-containing protein n=1 Tax=Penicillium steckii TaxID=303698 RepID=A0A1V6TT18_9EURO|nr:hypothetical protein PENSTE_c002G00485 [Penicillium steckii]
MVKGGLKMMANNQAKPSVLSTSYMSSRDLSQEGIDRQSYSSNTNESINSKPATDPSSWDSILSTIEASAADIGDYGTTSDALVIHINGVSKAETRMKKIQELASLSLSVMNDAVGCAICLVREARLIISHESSNLDQSDQRTDLYLRFKDFDELYPSWFEHPQLQNLPNLVAFDVPLACWEKMCALNQLLLSMNRPAGAQLSLSSQYVVERHLSTKRYPSDLRFLNREPCTGCYYCDKEEKSVRFPQSRRISHTRRIRRVSPSGSQKLANLKQIRTPDRTDGLKQPEKENSWQNSCDVEAELRPDSQEEASGHGKKTKSSPLDKIDSDCRTNSRPRVIVGFTGIPDVPDKSFNVSIALGESFEDFKAEICESFKNNKVVSPYLMKVKGSYDVFHTNGTRITDSNWKDEVHTETRLELRLVDLPQPEDVEKDQKYAMPMPGKPKTGRCSSISLIKPKLIEEYDEDDPNFPDINGK